MIAMARRFPSVARLAALCAALAAMPAAADPVVFHSPGDDGTNPGSARQCTLSGPNACPLPVSGTGVVHLYVELPSESLAGANLRLELQGPGSLVDFEAAPGVVQNPPCQGPPPACGLPAGTRKLRVVAASADAPAGVLHLGTLTVDISGSTGSELLATGFQVVSGAGAPEPVTQQLVALPEPGPTALLLSGLLGLAGLYRMRLRS